MLVSIIMATYNRASTLPRAIDSVLAQDHPDWEILVVDDGSTDATGEVLAHYNDGRIQLMGLPENRGVAAARNVALERMRGQWFTLLDSDDEIVPHALTRLLRVPAEVDPAIDAVTCNCRDPVSGLFTGLGVDHDQYLDLATEIGRCSGGFWGLTQTALVGDLRFNERLAGGENVFFYRISERARRYYVHEALHIYHTEGQGHLGGRDVMVGLDARRRFYAAVVQEREYLDLLRRFSRPKYAQVILNAAVLAIADGRREQAHELAHDLKDVGSVSQRTFVACGRVVGGRWMRRALPAVARAKVTAGSVRAAVSGRLSGKRRRRPRQRRDDGR